MPRSLTKRIQQKKDNDLTEPRFGKYSKNEGKKILFNIQNLFIYFKNNILRHSRIR